MVRRCADRPSLMVSDDPIDRVDKFYVVDWIEGQAFGH